MLAKIVLFCSSEAPKYVFLRCCLIIFAGFMVYCNTFNMSFNFDDAANIINNPVIREFNPAGIKQAFKTSRGVGIITFQMNYQLSGLNVFSYHLLNLFIHIASALLVYRFLALLLKTPCFREDSDTYLTSLPTPFFSALIFVVHPIQTQAVTYIVQRFTSLATLFYLAAAICYLQARLCQSKESRPVSASTAAWLAGCVAASFCAFNSKQIAYTLPLTLVLLECLCFRVDKKKLLAIAAISVTALGAFLLKFGFGKASFEQALIAMDEATRLQTITSRSDYLFTQFRVILTYIRLLFLPVNQSVEYDYALSHSFLEPAVLGSFSVLLLLFGGALILVRRSRTGNVGQRVIAFGIFWFFLTLAIESSVLPIIDLIFEHRVYLPSVGAIAAITTAGLNFAWRRDLEKGKGVACVALLLIAVVFAGAAWKRNLVWQSEVTLWEDATAKKPQNGRAWNNLGGAYIKQKDADKALHALVRAIELDPSKAAPWNNLGIAIDLKGVYRDRFNKTREMFQDPRAVEDKTVNRWLGDVNNNLGLAYEILGNLPKAAENYRNAVGYNPALTLAYFNLGIVSAAMGDYEKYMEQQQVLWIFDPVLAERLQQRVTRR